VGGETRQWARPIAAPATSFLRWLILDWPGGRDTMRVRDATFWPIRLGRTASLNPGRDRGTEVFFIAGAAHTEKEGTFNQPAVGCSSGAKGEASRPKECRSSCTSSTDLPRRKLR